MKKIFSIVCAGALMTLATACGGNSAKEADTAVNDTIDVTVDCTVINEEVAIDCPVVDCPVVEEPAPTASAAPAKKNNVKQTVDKAAGQAKETAKEVVDESKAKAEKVVEASKAAAAAAQEKATSKAAEMKAKKKAEKK